MLRGEVPLTEQVPENHSADSSNYPSQAGKLKSVRSTRFRGLTGYAPRLVEYCKMPPVHYLNAETPLL